MALSLVPGLNKFSRDVERTDGTVHTPVTPEAMAIIMFYAGLMMIFSHFAEILTLSLDGASENGRAGQGGEAMCGRNSQMDQLMIRRSIWGEVEISAAKNGIKDLLNRFYKDQDPLGLLNTLKQILRDSRNKERAASAEKKRAKKASIAGKSLAQEPVPEVSTNINEVGGSFPGSRHMQEQSPGESSNMNQGDERNANTTGGLQQGDRLDTMPEGSECSDEDGAGTDESDDNDDHDSECSSQDNGSESNTATQRGDSDVHNGEGGGEPAGQGAEGSGEPAGPANVPDALDTLKPWIGLPAPAPREPPLSLNTKGAVKPRKSNDNGEQNESGEHITNKYDYEQAIDVLRRRHALLRSMFQLWYQNYPPRFRTLKENKTYESRLKKYKGRTDAAEHAAAPGVGRGGYLQNVLRRLRNEVGIPAGSGDCPASPATDIDPVGRLENSEAAAVNCAKLAQDAFRSRLSRIRTKSYALQQLTSPRIKRYWQESKSARFEIRQNPLIYFACMDQRHADGDSAWSKICRSTLHEPQTPQCHSRIFHLLEQWSF